MPRSKKNNNEDELSLTPTPPDAYKELHTYHRLKARKPYGALVEFYVNRQWEKNKERVTASEGSFKSNLIINQVEALKLEGFVNFLREYFERETEIKLTDKLMKEPEQAVRIVNLAALSVEDAKQAAQVIG